MGQSPMSSPTSPRPPMSVPASDNGHKKVGPIIATLVIVLVLIMAALYVFATRINKEPVPTDTSTTAAVDQSPSVQAVTNTTDDPASLQSDLNASTKGLDQQNF